MRRVEMSFAAAGSRRINDDNTPAKLEQMEYRLLPGKR